MRDERGRVEGDEEREERASGHRDSIHTLTIRQRVPGARIYLYDGSVTCVHFIVHESLQLAVPQLPSQCIIIAPKVSSNCCGVTEESSQQSARKDHPAAALFWYYTTSDAKQHVWRDQGTGVDPTQPLFFFHTCTFQLLDKPWSQVCCHFSPPFLAFNFYRA